VVLINKARDFAVAMFGRGTLLVSHRPAQDDSGVVVNFEQCKMTAIGLPVMEQKILRPKKAVQLFFNSSESIDIVIAHLESAKQTLQEAKEKANGQEIQVR
jgi:hypothetical protein